MHPLCQPAVLAEGLVHPDSPMASMLPTVPCSLVPGMASVSLVPRGDADVKATLQTLQFNFELRDIITKELLSTGAHNLEVFRFLSEDEVKTGS